MKIVFLGDIVGKPGRDAVRVVLPKILALHQPDLVIANGENASGGLGIDPKTAEEIFRNGVQFITTGNHIWQKKEVFPYLEKERNRIIRPANFPAGSPGAGWASISTAGGITVGIVNLIGRVFMPQLADCPFRAVEAILAGPLASARVVVVDMHAEATSEKLGMGYLLDGRASLVVGTHTHVQTADNRILPKGTAYISDLGMCGPLESVIGVRSELVIERFKSSMPGKFDLASERPMLNGIVAEIDEDSGRARSIERLYELMDSE